MEFDVTKLDKVLLLQSLFAHSNPLGLGVSEYKYRKQKGDNVDGLTEEECHILLAEFNESTELPESFRIADYHKGKPLKIDLYKQKNGRVIAYSDAYDARNGKYRYLEALLDIFSLDEILIIKKGYRHYTLSDLPKHLIRTKEQEAVFKELLKNTNQIEDEYGKVYVFDEKKATYTPPFPLPFAVLPPRSL